MAVLKKQSVVPPSQGPLSSYTIDSQRKVNGYNGPRENGPNIKPNLLAKRAGGPAIVVPRVSAALNGNNVDERLRAARERREEQEKRLASRELSRLEREQRARQYHQYQLRERKKKLLEQRDKEERRRAAVEEKRNQKLKEEKERYESVVRKTQEKSVKAQQNHGQNSRGRKLTKNVPRRSPLSPWEKNLVSRLGTPTCSYLARSKSAGCESGQEVSFHSMNSTISTTPPKPKPQPYRPPPSPSPGKIQPRSVKPVQVKTVEPPDLIKKIPKSAPGVRSPAKQVVTKPSIKPVAPPVSPEPTRTASPSPERARKRSLRRLSTPLQPDLPSVPEEDSSVCNSAPAQGNSRPVRTSAEGRPERIQTSREAPRSNPPGAGGDAATRTAGDGGPSMAPPPRAAPYVPETPARPAAGTMDREEASRVMAEKRRQARLQKEKEEQERLQREEEERRVREELQRRRAEELERQQAEAQRLLEEKRRQEEEEEQKRAEEEKAQALRKAALLQKQREDQQARERAKAEQIKQEREIQAQKEEAERQARKKRLEEIMWRTRRTDSPDTKSVAVRILSSDSQPKENTEPAFRGTIENAIKLSKPAQLRLNDDDDAVPVVAFKERRSLRALAGLEEIQTHQRAEVI